MHMHSIGKNIKWRSHK